MNRRKSQPLTARETEIMKVLWDRGTATADEVRTSLSDSPHDSTVRTLLRVLEKKGHVRRDARGRVHRYRPSLPQVAAQRGAVRNLLARFFGGSGEALVLRLLEDEQLTPKQLDKLRNALKQVCNEKNDD